MAKSVETVDVVKRVEAILARARGQCIAEGVSPQQLAYLLLPEALLAFMVAGLEQDDTAQAFRDYAEGEVAEWYAKANAATERCDCAREHIAELQAENMGNPTLRVPKSNTYLRMDRPGRILAETFRPRGLRLAAGNGLQD